MSLEAENLGTQAKKGRETGGASMAVHDEGEQLKEQIKKFMGGGINLYRNQLVRGTGVVFPKEVTVSGVGKKSGW